MAMKVNTGGAKELVILYHFSELGSNSQLRGCALIIRYFHGSYNLMQTSYLNVSSPD
jgi:hypothetical protein